MSEQRYGFSLAEYFRGCGIPDDAIPDLVAKCGPCTWPKPAIVANEWLREHGRGEIMGIGIPDPDPEPGPPYFRRQVSAEIWERVIIDNPAALEEYCQDCRAKLLTYNEDDSFGVAVMGKGSVQTALRAIRQMGAPYVPEVDEQPASIAEAQRALDVVITWCVAQRQRKPQEKPKRKKRITAEEKEKRIGSAVLLVAKHPERKDADIADEVELHPSHLTRSAFYQEAAERARNPGKTRPSLIRPQGSQVDWEDARETDDRRVGRVGSRWQPEEDDDEFDLYGDADDGLDDDLDDR